MSENLLLQGVVLAAGDDGARAALEPLVAFGAHWHEPGAGAGKEMRALACGTSQSDAGFAREAEARLRAAAAGVPIVCIEDFPGNFRHLDRAPPRLLVVEGEFSKTLYLRRLGELAPPMAALPPARYDALRGRAPNLGSASPPYRVLWAGQPETESCLATLAFAASFLGSPEVEVLFRAHPRDAGYPGAYRPLGFAWRDVTAMPLEEIFGAPLDLVVTQFSSVAIEAGFLGVPSAHVLLPEAGGRLLLSQKGYARPMPCEAGASFQVAHAEDLAVLGHALRDARARAKVMDRFRELYQVNTPQAAELARMLAAHVPV